MNKYSLLIKFKFHILLLFFLISGGFLIQNLLSSFYSSKQKEYDKELIKVQEETVLRIETGINVYSTVVSSLKSFVQNRDEFPNDIQMQGFLSELIENIDFKDSIAVSFIDTNQIFQYTVTPFQIDPFNLQGLDVSKLRPDAEVQKLNKLMYQDNISLFAPINLQEGWAAFPFNFSAKNSSGDVLGYIAPVLNVKYLLDYSYQNKNDTNFIHRFIIEDSFDLSREVVYDDTKIFNSKRDPEYYTNFSVPESEFIYSSIDFYGLKLKIGTAYKKVQKSNYSIVFFAFLWYGLICILSFITLNQLLKNKQLNKKMRAANIAIIYKNNKLSENFENIQTLLKEVHHRVKNNMQIISSLLNLQRNSIEDKAIIDAIDTSKSRIQSMALVHQKLYGSGSLASVNTLEYVKQLVENIENTIEGSDFKPLKTIEINKEITLNMDTILPLGLILNELITNSYKYAFKFNFNPKLTISILKTNQNYKLVYTDNGKGIPDNMDFENSGTLGLELIKILSDQLQGNVSYEKTDLSTFTINFIGVKN